MRQGSFEILSNTSLAPGVYELVLEGDTAAITAPGQFVNLRLDGFFLRRPISVCDWRDGLLALIYKTVGRGTEALAGYPAGKKLDVLTGLGNGYDLEKSGESPLLVGGGVGIPPLYGLAKRLAAQGKKPAAVLGFNRGEDVFLADKFETLGLTVSLCTLDGSRGARGTAADGVAAAAGRFDYLFACGPEPMLRAVYDASETDGQFSFEERMGCGFGACMGCSRQTKGGMKRICRDGPVLERGEIAWQTQG